MENTDNLKESSTNEETLDPIDWKGMKDLGYRMVEDMMNYLKSVRERPVWQPTPMTVKEFFKKPVPQDPEGLHKTYQDFLENVLPYPTGNIHPRFWGWVLGTGTPFEMLAEMLAAGMNSNVGGLEHAANYVERQVIDWFKEIMGFPSTASGLLVSGGSMANLVGLTVARNFKAGYDLRKHGLQAASQKMTLYGSEELHSSNQKAVELLGLGSDALRKIPVNEEFQIDIDSLKAQVATDRENGYHPICIIGNAGTINTGAFDDFNSLAKICEKENIWFHVDGAFGAWAILPPKLKSLVSGINRADSVAFDLHKWMYMPYEVGCTLVKNEETHLQAFSVIPDYLHHTSRGIGGGKWFSEYGVQLSRGFRALKVWMGIKAHGIRKYGRLIQQNVDQAQYLVKLIKATSELELLAPVPLNIVCFRFVSDRLATTSVDNLNKELLLRLHESGIAIPSSTVINNKYALRVAITNHRSRRADFDLLVNTVVKLGKELM